MASDDPYRDPALYDLEYAGYTEDIGYYVQLARRAQGGVLELGCGSGRLTVPIARAGVPIVGVDLSEPMLAALERKLRKEPDAVRMRCQYLVGDYRTLDLGRTFGAVLMPFNAIHHCADEADVLKAFAVVRDHLRPGGVFAMDCYLPDPVLYARDPDRRYEERDFIDPRGGGALHSWEQGWWDEEAAVHHVVYSYEKPDGTIDRSHLALRMFTEGELLELFTKAGFRVIALAQDFQGTAPPSEGRTLKWVVLLRRTG